MNPIVRTLVLMLALVFVAGCERQASEQDVTVVYAQKKPLTYDRKGRVVEQATEGVRRERIPRGSMATRIVLVDGAEHLNKIKELDQAGSLEEKLLQYLKMNKVVLQPPSYAKFDEKTKALTVHASVDDLDKVDFLVQTLGTTK